MRESTTLPLRPEAGPDRGWEASYPGRTDQVRHVRAAVRDYLRDCPASDEVVLLVDELCANAVQFSGSGRPGGSFAVRVEHVAGRYVRAEVRDQGGDGWGGRTVWFRIGLGGEDE